MEIDDDTAKALQLVAERLLPRPSVTWQAREDGGGCWVARMTDGDDVICNTFTETCACVREDKGFKEE